MGIEATKDIAARLIDEHFPQWRHLKIADIEKQGHDNRTYRLGDDKLIRLPTDHSYALKVPQEQSLLPKLAHYLSLPIPAPVAMGYPTSYYPYHYSIYQWMRGRSLNLISLTDAEKESLARDLAHFLKSLQKIRNIEGPEPGLHNWWRGFHITAYDQGAREQIKNLSHIIESEKPLQLWEQACLKPFKKQSVWIHGDMAPGNLLIDDGRLSAVIDFGGMAIGDPACDLVMAWTYFEGSSRDIFINEMSDVSDEDTWLRAKAWALWKASYELCQIKDYSSTQADIQKRIIQQLLKD